MLQLHRTRHFGLPLSLHTNRKLALSPAMSERDELIQAIEAEHNEDNWQLSGAPDVQELETFWSGVCEDLKNDPDWFTFTDD